jgi:SMODS and SLOG-associating 2TM effector domain 3/SMODS and SLOG-associating 2TM effector domain 1
MQGFRESPVPTPAATMRESDYPALFTSADATAKRAQRRHTRLVQINLVLIVSAALFGVIEPINEKYTVYAAIASAISLGAALTLELVSRFLRLERRWYEDRAIAESVKSAAWRYMMRVDPFGEANADKRFISVLTEIADAYRDTATALHTRLDPAHQISNPMRRVRDMSFDDRKDTYLRQRVVDQINYYRFKSEKNARSATIWFWIGVVARGTAFLFALAAIKWPTEGARIVELLAAVAAAGTAWAQLGRHEEQAKSYGNAAQELMEVRKLIEDTQDEGTLKQRVVDAEGAISREHTLWMVKRA